VEAPFVFLREEVKPKNKFNQQCLISSLGRGLPLHITIFPKSVSTGHLDKCIERALKSVPISSCTLKGRVYHWEEDIHTATLIFLVPLVVMGETESSSTLLNRA
jgi:hypothetical protein